MSKSYCQFPVGTENVDYIGKKINRAEVCFILNEFFAGVFTGTLSSLIKAGIRPEAAYAASAGVVAAQKSRDMLESPNTPDINDGNSTGSFVEEDHETYFVITYESNSGNFYQFWFSQDYYDCHIVYPKDCSLANAMGAYLDWYSKRP